MPSVHTLLGIVGKIGKHANTILSTLREEFARKDIMSIVQELSDVPLRTQDIGRTINVIESQLKDWDNMRFARRDSVLRSGYSLTKDPGKKRFSTIIESTVENIRTGEKDTRHITILHDEPATRGSLEGEAKRILVESEVSPNLKVLEQKPVQGFTWKPRGRK